MLKLTLTWITIAVLMLIWLAIEAVSLGTMIDRFETFPTCFPPFVLMHENVDFRQPYLGLSGQEEGLRPPGTHQSPQPGTCTSVVRLTDSERALQKDF